jgi:hypothetical protein
MVLIVVPENLLASLEARGTPTDIQRVPSSKLYFIKRAVVRRTNYHVLFDQ